MLLSLRSDSEDSSVGSPNVALVADVAKRVAPCCVDYERFRHRDGELVERFLASFLCAELFALLYFTF